MQLESLAKGAVIGRYVVLGLVGRGGMGEVYAAYDPELDRKIAVKLLRGHAAGAADPASRLRLLREAQAIAKLSHPNVVVVYDVGTFQDSVFIAMEFVEGNTVGFWMKAEPRPWREVLKIFLAAGRGLASAHAAGMVHRDFKPDNVMVTRDGQVRVMDFGLARQLGEGEEPAALETSSVRMRALPSLGEASAEIDPDATARLGPGGAPRVAAPSSGSYLREKLTQTGALVGTPAYMAPEQFAAQPTDARTDQFSFCVALYEALYGDRPFEGDTLVTLMANVVSGTIREVPSTSSGDSVPAQLRKVLLVGLEPDPGKRHASMSDLLQALESSLGTGRRSRLTVAAAFALVALAVTGVRLSSSREVALCAGAGARLGGIWEIGAGSPRKEAMRAAFERNGKGHGAQIFASVSGLLDSYASAWAHMYQDACEATHVRGEQSAEALDLRMACLGQRLSNVRALTDLLTSANTSVVENAVSAAGSLPTLERCADIEMLRSVVPPPDQKTRERVEAIRANIARARAMGDAGQCEAGLAEGKAALAQAKEVDYAPLKAEASYVVGRAGNYCADADVAITALEDTVWSAESSRHDEVAIEAAHFAAALYAERLRDLRSGRRWLRFADAILERLPGHPMLHAYSAVGWGIQLLAEGRGDEALREQLRALELKEQFLGPRHPDTAISAMNVGLALHELSRDADAEPYAARAVETLESLLGPESAQGAMALLDYGEVLTVNGRFAAARRALERAIDIWKKSGASPFFISYARADLARVALREQHPAEAVALLDGAPELLEKEDRSLAAQARLLQAEALWQTPRDRARAVAVGRAAKEQLASTHAAPSKIAEADAWLAAHGGP